MAWTRAITNCSTIWGFWYTLWTIWIKIPAVYLSKKGISAVLLSFFILKKKNGPNGWALWPSKSSNQNTEEKKKRERGWDEGCSTISPSTLSQSWTMSVPDAGHYTLSTIGLNGAKGPHMTTNFFLNKITNNGNYSNQSRAYTEPGLAQFSQLPWKTLTQRPSGRNIHTDVDQPINKTNMDLELKRISAQTRSPSSAEKWW